MRQNATWLSKVTNRSAAIASALRALKEGVQQDACRWVVDRIDKFGEHLKEVFPRQIASDLNANSEDDMRDVLAALDILSLSSIGILQVGYELYDSDDVLAMPTNVSGDEVLQALKTGQLISPKTGMPVFDYEKHLAVVYRVRS